MKHLKLIEYLKTIFKVKRNFADGVNATESVTLYNGLLNEIEEAERMIREGDSNTQAVEVKIEEMVHRH